MLTIEYIEVHACLKQAHLFRVERYAIALNGLIGDLASELSVCLRSQGEAQVTQLPLIAAMARALRFRVGEVGDPFKGAI